MAIPKGLKPMKAFSGEWTMAQLEPLLPVYISPKLDGERSLAVNGAALSSSLKPVKNKHVQAMYKEWELHGLDGELVVGSPTARNPDTGVSIVRNNTRRGIGPIEGEPDFKLYVFDRWDRVGEVFKYVVNRKFGVRAYDDCPFIEIVPQILCNSIKEVEDREQRFLEQGYEGAVISSIDKGYKFNRSTWNEFAAGNGMIKLKRFVDAEAEVLEAFPLERNGNEAKTNALGHTERSTAKAGKVVDPLYLGKVRVRDIKTGVVFHVGTGWTADERRELMARADELPGKIMTYKHFPQGAKDAPNLPIFLAWRSRDDMTAH